MASQQHLQDQINELKRRIEALEKVKKAPSDLGKTRKPWQKDS